MGIVQSHIDRILKTYREKHIDNKELEAYFTRLGNVINSVPTGNLGAAPTIAPAPMHEELPPPPDHSSMLAQAQSMPPEPVIPHPGAQMPPSLEASR